MMPAQIPKRIPVPSGAGSRGCFRIFGSALPASFHKLRNEGKNNVQGAYPLPGLSEDKQHSFPAKAYVPGCRSGDIHRFRAVLGVDDDITVHIQFRGGEPLQSMRAALSSLLELVIPIGLVGSFLSHVFV